MIDSSRIDPERLNPASSLKERAFNLRADAERYEQEAQRLTVAAGNHSKAALIFRKAADNYEAAAATLERGQASGDATNA